MIPVQFITHQTKTISYEESALLALKGGCKWIQLRMKDASDEEVETLARRLKDKCREFDAVFVIDDRVELVKKIEADGVHLGKNDMPVDEARRFLGEGFLIGGTANTIEDVRRIHRASADYIGCGPFRYTETKKNLSPILGLAGYEEIMKTMRDEAITIPLCAIGGITLADVANIMSVGVDGIAVSGAVLNAADPVEEMKKFGTDHVYITLPTMTTEQAAKRFPNIFDACMEEGYDITKDKVPVTPAQHYMMGGIKTDLYGRTSMAHLYAAGETACNGVHGKNRLASNSLLESLVFAKRAADVIADDKSEKSENYNEVDLSSYPPKEERQKEFKKLIMDEIKEKDKDFYDKWCNTQG